MTYACNTQHIHYLKLTHFSVFNIILLIWIFIKVYLFLNIFIAQNIFYHNTDNKYVYL